MFKHPLNVILIIAMTAIITSSLYRCGGRGDVKNDIIKRDTLITVRVDTIRINTPIYIRSRIVDTVKVVDTLISRDTLYILITQRVYQDSNYTAYVSGYMPSLDSIAVYNRTIYRDITTTITPPKPRPKRWGLGIQAGYGVGTNGVQPYVGVGLSYNVFVF